MHEQIKQIAQRLKGIREIEEISVEEIASACGVGIEEYLSYESGNVDIPMSFLYEAANKFGIETTELLSGDAPKLKIYQLVRGGEGLDVERRKEYKYQNLAFNFQNKKSEIFTVEVPETADGSVVPLNSHHGHEFNYILEGTLKLIINNTELIMNPGDSLYFDASYAHGMQAIGGKAKFLALIF